MSENLARSAIFALSLSASLVIGTALSTLSSAIAQSLIIPPKQWWMNPEYSPDGTKVAIQSPPPEIIKNEAMNGRIYNTLREVPRKTVILKSKDFSLITTIDSELSPNWSPNSQYICTNSIDRIDPEIDLALYDATSGAKLRAINAMPPSAFAWSPDSNRLFLTQREALSILDIQNKTEVLLSSKTSERFFQNPQWSPDGKLIAASLTRDEADNMKDVIKVWDATNRVVRAEIVLKDSPIKLAWSPNGKLFICSHPRAISIFDATSMKLIRVVNTNETSGSIFNWSPDQTKFSYNDGGNIHILDAATMKEILLIAGPTKGIFYPEWSADGNFILISAQKTAAICDAKSGKYLGHKIWFDAARHFISPDQKLLVIQNLNDLTESEPIALPPARASSPFKDGKLGSPGWEHEFVPKTIEECFTKFDTDLIAANRTRFKNLTESRVGEFGGGSFMIDGMMADIYTKWSFTELKKYFQKRGISDSRVVRAIMLHSYWRYLNKQPISLDEQVASHKSWRDNHHKLK